VSTRPPVVEPSAEHLQAAFQRLRRTTWPATLEEALADGLRSKLVRMLACSLARSEEARPLPALLLPKPRPAPVAASPAPRPRHTPPAFHAPLPRLHHDPRRKAANDKDD